jgi:oxygen-independent coproporphyrinogen-3 oxidase
VTEVAHLYLHVPFCRRACPYCDAALSVDAAPALAGWLAAVDGELALRSGEVELARPVSTVHVGGGTPSTLGGALPAALRGWLGAPRVDGLGELAIEANPEDLDRDLLREWHAGGVTRVSVGIQSLEDAALAFLGRGHDSVGARDALDALVAEGLPSWGVDFLFGLPAEVDGDPRRSLERLLGWNPPHVSLYELVPEEGTPLERSLRDGTVELPDEEMRADQFLALAETMENAGYREYEMTSFARPGHESRHLRAVLSGADTLGLGPGAVSRVGGRVWQNSRNWREYERAALTARSGAPPGDGGSATDPRSSVEDEDPLVRLHDRLRLREGIPMEGLSPAGRLVVRRWAERGLAHPDPERVRLTRTGWLRLDSLAIELHDAGRVASADRDE